MSQHPILTRFSTSLPEGQRVSVRTASQLFILLAAVIEPWLLETLGPACPIIGPFPQNCPSHHSSSAPTPPQAVLQSTPRGHNPSCLSEPTQASCRPGRKPFDCMVVAARGYTQRLANSKVPRADSIRTFCRSSRLTGGHVAQPGATAPFLTARACGHWSTCCC
jgi:hypothetical protein